MDRLNKEVRNWIQSLPKKKAGDILSGADLSPLEREVISLCDIDRLNLEIAAHKLSYSTSHIKRVRREAYKRLYDTFMRQPGIENGIQ